MLDVRLSEQWKGIALTREEALELLKSADGDQILAAYNYALLHDDDPDSATVHWAVFLITQALGQSTPCHDDVAVELKRRLK